MGNKKSTFLLFGLESKMHVRAVKVQKANKLMEGENELIPELY